MQGRGFTSAPCVMNAGFPTGLLFELRALDDAGFVEVDDQTGVVDRLESRDRRARIDEHQHTALAAHAAIRQPALIQRDAVRLTEPEQDLLPRRPACDDGFLRLGAEVLARAVAIRFLNRHGDDAGGQQCNRHQAGCDLKPMNGSAAHRRYFPRTFTSD